jgi:hypothetical protein
VFRECHKTAAGVLQECSKSVPRVFQECSKSVPRVLQECSKSVTGVPAGIARACITQGGIRGARRFGRLPLQPRLDVTADGSWGYSGVTVVLQRSYSGVTVLLQCCHSGLAMVLKM